MQTSFLLANEGVPRIWNLALSPNKAYAAVVQSVPGDGQQLQVRALLSQSDLPGDPDKNERWVFVLMQCAVYSLAKNKRARTLRVDVKYSSNTDIQALTFRSAHDHGLICHPTTLTITKTTICYAIEDTRHAVVDAVCHHSSAASC